MVDVTRKQQYSDQRVLVKAKNFLNPDFSDACLYFTGGHIELMRNLVDYANRRSTFVSDYYTGYYTSPNDEDWDLIQQRVADLEETLMGNNNVVWGYKDKWKEWESRVMGGAGTFAGSTDDVPAGEIYVLHNVTLRNLTGARGAANIQVDDGVRYLELAYSDGLAVKELMSWKGPLVLEEGDSIHWTMDGCLEGDSLKAYAMGYKMEVPTA